MYALYRLNPHLNARPRASSMFDVAKAVDGKLIKGERWGDDYLVLPEDQDVVDLVESLLREEGVFFERVDSLPSHHQWQLV
jgi:hypothetical protein